MARYKGMNRFETGKSIAHRKAEIQATTASVVRIFKSGGIPSEMDLDYIIEQAQEIKEAVEFWTIERKRELGQVVKTK